MIHGLNFGGQEIPVEIKRRFAARVKLPGMGRGEYLHLKGVATDVAAKHAMLLAAHNGRRTVHVVPRKTVGGIWYGFYVS